MNLGVFETRLVEALRPHLPVNVLLVAGPCFAGPATGARPEVFVHAARFDDLGGVTADGAVIGRVPWQADAQASGFEESRPARIEIEITFVCAQPWQARTLAGQAATPLLRSLETLNTVSLGDPTDHLGSLVFTDQRAVLHACRTERQEHDGVAVHHAVLTLRLEGFLRVRLAAPGGLLRDSAFAGQVPTLEVCFDPTGIDLPREHAILRNPSSTLLDLAGWTIEDAAPKRPHRYRFPPLALIVPGGELRLFSGRGQDNATTLYWGRRQAVWNNTGDIAILRDPDGVERARAVCVPAPKPAKLPRKRR